MKLAKPSNQGDWLITMVIGATVSCATAAQAPPSAASDNTAMPPQSGATPRRFFNSDIRPPDLSHIYSHAASWTARSRSTKLPSLPPFARSRGAQEQIFGQQHGPGLRYRGGDCPPCTRPPITMTSTELLFSRTSRGADPACPRQ